MITSQLAALLLVHPQTIRRWTNQGKLACSRTLGNHRRFTSPATDAKLVVGYARASSHDQKEDLVRQKAYLATDRHLDNVILDTGSGMNYKKPGFRRLIMLILQGKLKELVLNHHELLRALR
jgi:putative resolvase